MDLKVENRLKQSPLFSLAMQHAVEILQMTQLEIAQIVEQELEKNPLLEELPRRSSSFSKELPPNLTQAPSLYETIIQQIRECSFSFEEKRAAEMLYHFLDEKGFLSLPLEEISKETALPLPLIEKILLVLQTFHPPGIFAKNLQESLLLQLRALGETHSGSYFLVKHCFTELLQGKFKALEKKMVSFSLKDAVKKLSRLAFRPARAFQKEPSSFLKADLSLLKVEGKWLVEVLEEEIPQVAIRQDYLELSLSSDEEKAALRSWKISFQRLFRALTRRREILLELGILILKKQEAYLEEKQGLSPLSMKEAASLLELHESTLSRAIHGKCLLSPRGLLPLRSFFSASEQETFDIKKMLISFIEKEKSPLSDEKLHQALKERGFSIARRTVAKYRKQLKIAPASKRRIRNLS